MARIVTVVLVDDLDGEPAVETVRFGMHGTGYEIDLSAEHAAELRQVLAPFLAAARPTSRARGTAHPQPRPHPRTVSVSNVTTPEVTDREGEVLIEMREWARANGFPVGERGRISQEAREAFLATPPQVRAEQAVTFAELAELADMGSTGRGKGAAGAAPRVEFRAGR